MIFCAAFRHQTGGGSIDDHDQRIRACRDRSRIAKASDNAN